MTTRALELPLIASHFVRAKWRWRTLRGAALERYQEQRVARIISYAQQHAPFYREHWAGNNLRDWRNLPIVDKGLMMAHFDTFNTCGISSSAAMEIALNSERTRDFRPTLDGCTIGLSSGTSGHRGLFVASPWEQTGWAGVILARSLHRFQGKLRVAFFLRANNNLYEHIGGLFLQFRYFDLMLPLADAITALNDFCPHIIVGPPSLLGLLAEARRQGTLRATPERVVAVAEVLEPQDKEQIAAAFNAPVHQIYQCTEGLLAVSCAAGALHIQEDIVAMQFEPLAGGEAGRVTPIITDLWRKTQPIIRYRLNDVLQLDPQPCRCGSSFQVIRAIEGRCDDICYFDSRLGGTRLCFPDTIRRMILLASPQIEDYQVIQEHCGHLRVHLSLVPSASFDAVAQAVRAQVATTLAEYECCPATVSIEQGLLPVAPGVKRRRVQRLG
jgi:putative adenylate-forming enzyme